MKNRKTNILIILLILVAIILSGCTEAERVTQNIKNEADKFNVTRRIVVFNTRTDTVLYELIAKFSISNSSSSELQITSLIGEDKYKLDYIYLNGNITYLVQDMSDYYNDPYHYEFNILPKWGKIEQEP